MIDAVKKQELRVERALHRKQARYFYQLARDTSDDTCIISFDCAKNQPLPKVPDSAAYYSRQLYLYNFTAVVGPSRCPFKHENVKAFCWFEHQFPKDSNSIASCLFYLLKTRDLSAYKHLRLVSDGCPGQNKNSIVLLMCMYWFANFAPPNIETVSLVFPVTGHSWMNPDRIFGCVEREVKKLACIIQPEELLNIVRKYEDVLYVPDVVPWYDFRLAARTCMKSTQSWPFAITKCKRLILTKVNQEVLVRGELFYGHDQMPAPVNLLTRGQQLKRMNFQQIPLSNVLAEAKRKDVAALLQKHFGDGWEAQEDLQFYKEVLSGTSAAYALKELEECCYCEEPPALIV